MDRWNGYEPANDLGDTRLPVHPGMGNPGIAAMSMAHLGLHSPKMVATYLSALDDATLTDIELGRLQLRTLLDEVYGSLCRMEEIHPLMRRIPAKSPWEAAEALVAEINDDASRLSLAVRSDPRDLGRAGDYARALGMLAQAEAMGATLAMRFEAAIPFAARAAVATRTRTAEAQALVADLGAAHPELGGIIRQPAEIRADAARDAVIPRMPGTTRLTWERLHLAGRTCGDDRHAVWLAAFADRRDAAIEAGTYRPLDREVAGSLCDQVRGILREYDEVFHARGFAALVRQAAVVSRWGGLRCVAGSLDPAQPREVRDAFALDAAEFLAAAEVFDTIWMDANPEAPARPTLRLRREDGGVVGTFDDGDGGTFVIRPAPVAGIWPDGALAGFLPTHDGNGRLPTPEEMRDAAALPCRSMSAAMDALAVRDRGLLRRLRRHGAFAVSDETRLGPGPEPALRF